LELVVFDLPYFTSTSSTINLNATGLSTAVLQLTEYQINASLFAVNLSFISRLPNLSQFPGINLKSFY